MKRKKIFILLILIVMLFSLSGCYDSRGIEELVYVTALGLDASDGNEIILTLQISIPSSSSGSGSSQGSKTDNITVKCSNIDAGIALANSSISKEINLSHCKVIIISEKLASMGISKYIDTLINNIEVRPDCNVVICRCTAKDFIKNAKPSLETITTRYYEVAVKSSEYTGYTTSAELVDFAGSIKNSFIQASSILSGINYANHFNSGASSNSSTNNNVKPSNSSQSTDSSPSIDNDFVAGETPIDGTDNIEAFGTAVFYNDRLVGELNGIETICHLLVSNKLKSCNISIPDIYNSNSNIELRLMQKKDSKIDVELVNGTAYISVEVFLEGYGLSLDENIDYNSDDTLDLINSNAENYLEHQIEDYLYRTSKELNSDIDGFGKNILSEYKTLPEWFGSSWLENYRKSFFKVRAHVNIKSGSEFNKSP